MSGLGCHGVNISLASDKNYLSGKLSSVLLDGCYFKLRVRYIDVDDRLDDITCARKSKLGGFLWSF